jgi:hypothetical protein
LKISQCFPSKIALSKALGAANAMGISAQVEGLCIHFDPPADLNDLKKILSALKAKDVIPLVVE